MTPEQSCKNCGAALLPDARFCRQCGAPVQASYQPGTVTESTTQLLDSPGSRATDLFTPQTAGGAVATAPPPPYTAPVQAPSITQNLEKRSYARWFVGGGISLVVLLMLFVVAAVAVVKTVSRHNAKTPTTPTITRPPAPPQEPPAAPPAPPATEDTGEATDTTEASLTYPGSKVTMHVNNDDGKVSQMITQDPAKKVADWYKAKLKTDPKVEVGGMAIFESDEANVVITPTQNGTAILLKQPAE